MLMAAALAGFLSSCVPARWFSGDPKSLALLDGSPVNCLLVERRDWNADFAKEGHRRGLKLLAIIHPAAGRVPDEADAAVVESDDCGSQVREGKPVVCLASREYLRAAHGVAGTTGGVWAGIRFDDEIVAGPTAAPWIETNLGYLRYVSSLGSDTVWLANRPPQGASPTGRRYQVMFADATLAGAQWVIAPDRGFAGRLIAGDTAARADWAHIQELAAFAASLPRVRTLPLYSRLGVNVAIGTGALVSGGVLDMIASQHIPFHVVRSGAGMERFFDFAGDTIVKFPRTSLGRVAMLPRDVDELEPIYRLVQVVVGRTNYGLRVFNGGGLLSVPYDLPDKGGVLVLLVNYTDYPAEDITLHVRGKWAKAALRVPGAGAQGLSMYPVGDATAIEIPKLPLMGAVTVE